MDLTTAMKTLIEQSDSKVLARGKALYAEGYIERLAKTAEGEFEAEVLVTSLNTGLRIGMNTRLSILLEQP